LIPASRNQDHTASPSEEHAFVRRTRRVHRIPRSTFVTTRNAPPDERGTANALLLFPPNEKAKYFLQENWT
jgi:hypothetical protein